jgi:hypothetical protein
MSGFHETGLAIVVAVVVVAVVVVAVVVVAAAAAAVVVIVVIIVVAVVVAVRAVVSNATTLARRSIPRLIRAVICNAVIIFLSVFFNIHLHVEKGELYSTAVNYSEK